MSPPASPSARRRLIALALVALPLIAFPLITWQVAVRGPLARADERVSGAVVDPDRVSGLLADLGNIAVAVPVLAVVLLLAARHARRARRDRWWLPPVAAAALMAAVPAVIVPLKTLIARPGPPVMGQETGFFPSGHTATAVIAYGAAAVLLWPLSRTPSARRAVVALCLLLNLAVAYGLVRHGYHWPLDVLASWCLGVPALGALGLLLGRGGRLTH
ncbi:phosphatase PAP2 family protein [Streptomyces sp. NPDC052051]|uniref:phosphatase PAP2 family protein n=1 Tax=Streptomyces sp. NPDC052051 TaxID=3154649 RepID=UPI00343C9F84